MKHPQTLIPHKVRAFQSGDLALVLGTWLPGYWRGASSPMRWCSLGEFSAAYQNVVEQILKASTIRVACAPSDENLILSYMVFDGTVFHWGWVGDPYRRQNLFWTMLETAGDMANRPMAYSHETISFRRHLAPKLPMWKYRPEAVRDVVKQ